MNIDLQGHMIDLPMPINGAEDLIVLSQKYGIGAFGVRTVYKEYIRKHVQPDELIYFADSATYYAIDRHTGKRTGGFGGVVFTNKRFIGVGGGWLSDKNVSFALTDICTVAAGKGALLGRISFRTPSADVEISKLSVTEDDILALLRETIISIAANPDNTPTDSNTQDAAEADIQRVVECPGCSATIIIRAGTIGKCEYCDKVVEATQNQIPNIANANSVANSVAPSMPTTGIADELRKYKELLDMGVINQAEFDDVKGRLLERL